MSLSSTCKSILLNDLPILRALPELNRDPYDYYYANRLAAAVGTDILTILYKYPDGKLRTAEHDRIVKQYNSRPEVIAQSPKGQPWSDKDWDYTNHRLSYEVVPVFADDEEVVYECPTLGISSESTPVETSTKAKDILDWLCMIFKKTR